MAHSQSISDVIVLDDDDPYENVGIPEKKCINYSCTSGVDLMTPPIFCLTYYRIKGKAKGYQICRVCFDIAAQHFDDLAEMISCNQSVFSLPVPSINETVSIDSDSDTDDDEDEVMIDGDTMAFISNNLDDVISELEERYNFPDMLSDAIADLQHRSDATTDSILEVRTMVDSVRKELDTMLYSLGNTLRVQNEELPELSISAEAGVDDSSTNVSMAIPSNLPKRAPMCKPPLVIGQYYYSKKNENGLSAWVPFKLENIIPPGSKINNIIIHTTMHQICRTNGAREQRRFVVGSSLAYSKPMNVMLEIGSRVIALFHDSTCRKVVSYYPGIVGEFPSSFNMYRYLIFFDDGYAYYVHFNDVLMVFESTKDVWEDVHCESRTFIKKYLTEYPNRSMVKLLKDQRVRTEYRGHWYNTTAIAIDCSLVQIEFEAINRREWIYRGSRRLNTMYQEEQAASKQRHARARSRPANVTGAPYVQYSSVADDGDVVFVSQTDLNSVEQRAVAKKSTRNALPSEVAPPAEQSTSEVAASKPEERGPGKIVYYTPRRHAPIKKEYDPHKCSPKCNKSMQTSVSRLKAYGPLAKPILCGFHRMQYKAKNRRAFLVYRAPCGRSLRNMDEVHMYLQMVQSDLTVDLFNFDPLVRCLAEFILTNVGYVIISDLSDGQEPIALPVVNYVDNTICDFVNYATRRMPMDGVNLNLNPQFLCGCDCEDDCIDKTKCACWKLTLEGARFVTADTDKIGYVHRRLLDPVITGIYECNSRCRCAKTCLNRVVQNPLQHKLHVFRTSDDRGWGIRCINDIPRGTFICIYAGMLLTDQMANEGGFSDEYYAELDFIESVENIKLDYEEDAYESDGGTANNRKEKNVAVAEHSKKAHAKDNRDFVPDINRMTKKLTISDPTSIRSRLRKRDVEVNYKKLENISQLSEDDEDEEEEAVGREPSSFNPESDMVEQVRKYPSVRTLFGKEENVYIMDAKCTGNLGRFLNHSCAPNMFVQNVFVDTHDLRFPWVAFFAMQYIRAGTELTWNYNYDVGSVEDKILYCNCGSLECKGRLL